MFFLAGAALVAAVSTAMIVRLRECHVSVSELFSDLAASKTAEAKAVTPGSLAMAGSPRPEPSDAAFTQSLLALGRVGLRVPGDSPTPASAESSSLVSVHHAQSKSPDLAP